MEFESNDEKTYSIESVSLVFEKFRSMMQKSKVIAVVDAFPEALNEVIDSINEAIERGVDVYVQAYKPITIKGADVAYAKISENALDHWKSEQLNLVIDGEEYLTSLMNDDLTEVKQANWSNNIYMACMMHGGRINEQAIMKIMAKIDSNNFEEDVKEIINDLKFFYNSNIPGFNKLFQK